MSGGEPGAGGDIGDGVITTNRDGHVASINLVAQHLTGWSEAEALGQPLEQVLRIIADGTGGASGADALLVTKNGGARPIDDSTAPIRDEEGRLIGSVVIFRDATAQRRAHSALQHLAAVITSSDDAIITKDLTGRITTWNDGAARIFGYTAEEAVGQSITMLIPADRHGEEERILRQLRQGIRVMPFETVRIHKTGRRLDISVTSSPIHDPSGRVIGASKIARDISQRVRRDQLSRFLAASSAALADLRDYESTLQEVARLAVPWFADLCAVDIQTDDGSVRRLALVQASPGPSGREEEMLRMHPPEPADWRGPMQVIRGGESVWQTEVHDDFLRRIARDEAHLAWLRQLQLRSYICVPVRSRRSAVGAFTFATTAPGRTFDDTDLLTAEDLAHRAAIAIENASLVASLQESDRRKDEFLAMLAHELRNPLAPIRNAAQIIRLRPTPGPELARAAEMIDRQVHQMTRLVDDLLDVSRIQSGKIMLHPERVDLLAVVRSVVESCRSIVELRGHQLSVTLPPAPVIIHGDPIRLGQILFNLLDNAAKYTDPGGQIRVIVTREDEWVTLRIRDNGIGITAEMLTKVFEMFTQADRSLDRSQGGLGIGLMLVRSLVNMHGGQVSAASDGHGCGSEFVVRLPLTPLN